MSSLLSKLWRHDEGQDIAEYAVMLAVILVGVAYNAHVMEAILTSIAPALGWH